MEQFNLEEYVKNPDRKVVTRDCKSVRIICTNKKDERYPVVALVQDKNSNCEKTHHYTIGGKWIIEDDNSEDLFFAPEKKTGWINVIRISSDKAEAITYTGAVYPTKEEAIAGYSGVGLLDTIQIEWEE